MGEGEPEASGRAGDPAPVPTAAEPTPLPSAAHSLECGTVVPAQTGPGPARMRDAGIKGARLPAEGTGWGTKATLLPKCSPAAGEELGPWEEGVPATKRQRKAPQSGPRCGPAPSPGGPDRETECDFHPLIPPLGCLQHMVEHVSSPPPPVYPVLPQIGKKVLPGWCGSVVEC